MATSKINPVRFYVLKHTLSNLSVPAGTGLQGSLDAPSVPDMHAIGIVGAESSAWQCAITKFVHVISSDKIYWAVRNTTNSAQTTNLDLWILYVPTSIGRKGSV